MSYEALLNIEDSYIKEGDSTTIETGIDVENEDFPVSWDAVLIDPDGNLISLQTCTQNSDGFTLLGHTVTLNKPGTWTAKVKVYSDKFCLGINTADEVTGSIIVENVDTDSPPNAEIDAPSSVVVGETASIDASGSTDDNGIDAYDWNIEDKGDINGEFIDVSWNTTGTKTVELTVMDSAGQTDTATTFVDVVEGKDASITGVSTNNTQIF